MKTIGITGGIGAGKTYVSQLMQEHYGLPTYNCDNEAKRLTNESAEIREQLTALLGPGVYAPDGRQNKQLLAQYLFSGKDNAQRINAIIHPSVRRDFIQWKDEQTTKCTCPALLLESAILMESHFDDLCDEIIIVTAPLELRIERACKRDNSSAEAIRQRIQSQLSDEERIGMVRNKADGPATTNVHTIVNDGSPLHPQIEKIITQI